MHSLVKDLMTTPVVTVELTTPFKKIVARLAEHHISAVPVVDHDQRVLGVVSEADLLLKEELPEPDKEIPRWWTKRARLERERAAASAARDLMTVAVVSIAPRRRWLRRPGRCTPPESSGCPWSSGGAAWLGSSAGAIR
jgi:CBS-domain-containing membrane protein